MTGREAEERRKEDISYFRLLPVVQLSISSKRGYLSSLF